MLTDIQREIFSRALDAKGIERESLLIELKEDMGAEAYSNFINMGKRMFAPAKS